MLNRRRLGRCCFFLGWKEKSSSNLVACIQYVYTVYTTQRHKCVCIGLFVYIYLAQPLARSSLRSVPSCSGLAAHADLPPPVCRLSLVSGEATPADKPHSSPRDLRHLAPNEIPWEIRSFSSRALGTSPDFIRQSPTWQHRRGQRWLSSSP